MQSIVVHDAATISMKTFIALALLASVAVVVRGASTETFRAMVEPVLGDCKSEVEGATDDDVANVLHREELNTRSGKCLQMCVYEKLGGMKDGRLVSREAALAVLHQVYDGDAEKLENAAHKIDKCGDEVLSSEQTDGCEIANVIQQCFRKMH